MSTCGVEWLATVCALALFAPAAPAAPSPDPSRSPRAPVVGRAAETRAPAGGLLLDRFGVPLPARPWSDEGVRLGRSVLHLGLTLEAGWLGYSGPDPEAAGNLLDHTPTLRAVSRLALGSVSPIPVGEHRIRYGVHAAVGYRHQLEGEMIHTVPRQLVEVRSRAHLAVDLARRVTLGVAAQYRRHLQRSRLGLDHRLEDYADARLRLRGWILPARLALRLAYRFALGYPEDPDDRLDRYRDHDLELGVDYRGGRRWGVGLTLQAGLGEHRMQRLSPYEWEDAGRRRVIPLRAIAHGFWRLGSNLVTTAGLGFATAFLLLDPAPVAGTSDDDPHLERIQDVVGHAGVGLELAAEAWLGVGYWHDLRAEPGPFALLVVDSVYLSLEATLAERVHLRLLGALAAVGYHKTKVGGALGIVSVAHAILLFERMPERGHPDDCRILARAEVDWDVLPWLAVGLSYGLQAYRTEFDRVVPTSVDPNAPLIRLGRGYLRHRIVGRLALRY